MSEPTNGQLYVVPEAAKPFRREGLGYCYEPLNTGVRFRVDRITKNNDGMRARIEVESTLPGVPPHIYQGRHLLEGSRSLADLKKALEEIGGHDQHINWGALIRQLTKGVVDAEEAGEPFVLAGGRRERRLRPPDTIEKLLPAGKPTQWYGAGSAGKGWLAVLSCICVSVGQPLAGLAVSQGEAMYLDWEDDQDTFDERVELLSDGLGIEPPRIWYRPCRRGGALHEQIHTISREVDRRGVRLVVVDSVSMAAGSSGDRGSYEETAVRLMTAVGLINATVLLVDHVNAEGKEGKGLAGRSYGSVFKGYLCRSTWEVRKDQQPGEKVSHVGFFHTKANHSELHLPLGFRLDFTDPARVVVAREDVRESDTLSENVSLAFKLTHAMRNGCRTVKALAEAVDAKEDTVYKTLCRGRGKQFIEVIPAGPGGQSAQWGAIA